MIIYGNDLTTGSYISPEQSFGAQLERKLRTAGFDVTVETIGNADLTTVDAIKEIGDIAGKAPDLIILQLGEADIKRKYSSSSIYENIRQIIHYIKSKNIYVVVMGTKAPASAGKEYITEISKIFKKMQENTSTYLDPLENIIGNQDFTIGDNYHPNARGVAFMVDTIHPLVDAGLRWRIKVINELRTRQQPEF